ncbi:hypothetical protein NLG97_g3038 [Lecanicillium saksenae]|uniref:Uncharacterized protein n=1 Tax=Lecanicillium saksenae TaxID=468837 RepID=A0ACC1QZ75_9HYPO|nr:hypothetical protein NLG97_g3038 [Lecanicillium saksenae]
MWFRRRHQPLSTGTVPATADTTPILVESRQQSVLRYWKWEAFSLVLAVCLLATIAAVLGSFNGRMQSEWSHSININTLMALLGTALKACLVGTLAAIISQSKWIWFYEEQQAAAQTTSHEKSSQDLQRFDSASRGVFGSLKLMGKLPQGMRRSPLAFLSAITLILSIAIGPFIQQAIKTETCPMQHPVGEKASLPVAFNLPGADSWSRQGAGVNEPGIGLKGALVRGLTNPDSKDLKTEATCTTGNCTFPETRMAVGNVTHSTLAMCTKCMDFTDLVKNVTVPQDNMTTVDPFNFTLDKIIVHPNVVGVGGPRLAVGPINLTAYEPHLTQEFKDVAIAAVSNISVLTMPPQPKGGIDYSLRPVAAVCALYICLQDIRAAVRQGQLDEQIISTTPATIYDSQIRSGAEGASRGPGAGGGGVSGSITARLSVPAPGSNPTTEDRTVVKSPCVIDDAIYTANNFSLVPNVTTKRMFRDLLFEGKQVSVPSDCYYTMSSNYALAIAQYLDSTLLLGSCALNTGFQALLGCNGPFWLASLYKQKNLTFASLEQSFIDLAAAATTFFRADGWGPLNITDWYDDGRSPRPAKRTIIGQPQQVTVCIRLRWQWLLYTSILCVITIVLLVMSLVSTRMHRERPVWKSSLLPLLYLDFRPPDSEKKASAFDRGHTLHELRQMSKTTSFRMETTSKTGGVQYDAVERNSRDEEDIVDSNGPDRPVAATAPDRQRAAVSSINDAAY